MLRYKTETRPGLVALYDIRPGNGWVNSYNPGARTGPWGRLACPAHLSPISPGIVVGKRAAWERGCSYRALEKHVVGLLSKMVRLIKRWHVYTRTDVQFSQGTFYELLLSVTAS